MRLLWTIPTMLLCVPLAIAIGLAVYQIPLASPSRELIIFALAAMETIGGAIGVQLFLSYTSRPKLRIIDYVRDSNGQVATFGIDLASGQYSAANVARLLVRNDGRSAAEECRARLTIVDNRIGGDLQCYLCWTEFSGPQVLTIGRGETVRLDVFGLPTQSKIHGGSPRSEVLVPCAERWTGYIPVPRPGSHPPTVRVRIQIFSKNADPSSAFETEI